MTSPAYVAKIRERLAVLPPPPDRPFVLLVTGSRNPEGAIWSDVIGDCLAEVNAWLARAADGDLKRFKILRHGGAAGIDTLAHIRCGSYGYSRDRMPADWNHWGRRSGVIRNHAMVTKTPTPQLCLAFFAAPRSAGTADCARQAVREGIPTIPITVEDLYMPHA